MSVTDEIDRRGFLKCMAWAGTGLVWTIAGGVLSSCGLPPAVSNGSGTGDFTFVQLSDSHIGFNNVPNADVTGTFQKAIARVTSLPTRPAFVLHTRDISHLSMPAQYDTVDQSLTAAKFDQVFYVPGEHDTFVDNGKAYLDRFGKGTTGNGWRSFDYKGVHVVGLINVWNPQSAASTAFPQPAPGDAPAPGPPRVVPEQHHHDRPDLYISAKTGTGSSPGLAPEIS